MNAQSLKRTFDRLSPEPDEHELTNTTGLAKYIEKEVTVTHDYIKLCKINSISTIQDLCTEIFLVIFQYLRPLDILYSFSHLYDHLDALVEPYTPALDFRCVNKSYFKCLTKSLFPCFTNNLHILRLSNAYTFGQIRETLDRLDWSQITQLESLTLDFIEFDELLKYFQTVHPLLQHLWRLSLTFNENDRLTEKLIIDEIFIPINSFQSLKHCFINGIIFDLSRLSGQKLHGNLRELTITLATINDLMSLFRSATHLEILTCTIMDSTANANIDKIQPLDVLKILTLTIRKSMPFKMLEKLLISHSKLERLSLKAILCDETTSISYDQEINGYVLEKLFRTFFHLKKLDFYLRHIHSHNNVTTNFRPDYLFLFSFTSRFWLDRSIEVSTHFVLRPNQRYIYTLPFAFDSFDIVDDIKEFFSIDYPYHYANVRHLSLSSMSNLDQSIYSNIILKFFPNIQTITFTEKPALNMTLNILTNNQWIRQKSGTNISSSISYPCVYIHNTRKQTHLHVRTLNIPHKEQILLANSSKHIRQITIHEMTQEQSMCLRNFFPWVQILTLYISTLDGCFTSNDWLYHLLTDMPSLFSLTIYYPKYLIDGTLRDLLANTLLTVKKHFYIKCNDGILNIWF
ncbi:unnamed protein product [Rotaria socialis]|uniref:F-box domain-containing protein n=2 Tax=Rotaria socialis TaxID=392032 RepID=A0A817S3I4_9BILA|nr:unnamed protein product [Rotaria socialis]CAF4271866.1 unnamed protein product [Rotaria socialis]